MKPLCEGDISEIFFMTFFYNTKITAIAKSHSARNEEILLVEIEGGAR